MDMNRELLDAKMKFPPFLIIHRTIMFLLLLGPLLLFSFSLLTQWTIGIEVGILSFLTSISILSIGFCLKRLLIASGDWKPKYIPEIIFGFPYLDVVICLFWGCLLYSLGSINIYNRIGMIFLVIFSIMFTSVDPSLVPNKDYETKKTYYLKLSLFSSIGKILLLWILFPVVLIFSDVLYTVIAKLNTNSEIYLIFSILYNILEYGSLIIWLFLIFKWENEVLKQKKANIVQPFEEKHEQ